MRWLIAAVMMFGIIACRPEITEDSEFHAVPARGWAYGDTLTFEPGLSDSIVEGRLAVAVRHSSAYIFGNLWIEVTIPPAPGDSVAEVDTFNVVLADDYGKWLGRGSGVSFVKVDTLPGRHAIERGRNVAVRHIMRVDTVTDIEQVGIIFLKS